MVIKYIHVLFILVTAYTIGSLPIGFWIAQARGVSDIRQHGSGNIGATNVARTLGSRYFVIVFLLDCLKAATFLWLLSYYSFDYSILLLSSVFLLLGNGFSVFLHGSGGKGVATTVGILLGLNPTLALIFCSVWILIVILTRTAGIASVIACLLLPGYALYMPCEMPVTLLYVFISLWIVWCHWDNVLIYCVGG